MKNGLRFYLLWTVRIVAAVLGVLQVLGLLPALTWINDPSAITPDLIIKVLIKAAALAFFYLIYRWSVSAINGSPAADSSADVKEVWSVDSPKKIWWRGHVVTALALVLLMAFGFACYVWPTKYRYDHVTLSGSEYPVRTNRFTGETEFMRGFHGWVPVKVAGRSAESETAQPAARWRFETEKNNAPVGKSIDPSGRMVSHGENSQSQSTVVHPNVASERDLVPGNQDEISTARAEAIRVLSAYHPDWKEIRRDPRYGRWLSRQDAAVQALARSESYEDAIQLIDLYKADFAAGNVR